MFMLHRYSGYSYENFTPDYKLSKLISGGFSPEMAVVLTRPSNAKTSKIRVTFERVQYKYFLQWHTEWHGRNYKVARGEDPDNLAVFEFKIDWKNRRIRPVKAVGPVKVASTVKK